MEGRVRAIVSTFRCLPGGGGSNYGKHTVLVPTLLGVIHAIVDATTVSAVMRATRLTHVSPQLAFAMVVGYDIIAFGSQVFLGWLTDRFLSPRIALVSGLVLTALGLVSCPIDTTVTVAVAGIGNALFHLGGGALVLGSSVTRAAPQGVFVAPGALGLGFGLYYGAVPTRGPLWPLLALTLTALAAFILWERLDKSQASRSNRLHAPHRAVPRHAFWILALLLASVTVRSLVGLSAARGYVRTELLILGLPIAAFLGKALGGFLADRLGWLETSVVALLLAIPLITFAPPTPWLLLGLFVFQMTMPVTLTAVAQLMPNHLATALGWTCLALILGALPTMFPSGNALCVRPLLGVWIALAAACLALGLHLLGVRSLLRPEVSPNVA